MLDESSKRIAEGLFRRYYEKANFQIGNVNEREFGFGDFEKKIAYRHYSFKDNASLKRYLAEKAPAFASYSSSLYRYPDRRPMERKEWLGSGLIFDLDATDLHLECQSKHGSSWVCQNCLDGVKAETIKLIEDFLVPDFGFSKGEISVNFSGNRGYHVRVDSKELFSMTSQERKGISDYIAGVNLDITRFFPTISQRGKRLTGPTPSDYGWGGKLAKAMVSALNSGVDSLASLGIDRVIARKLVRSKADVIFGITTGNWDKVNIPRKGEFWGNVMKRIAIAQGDSIDKNVTNDIYHLIRIPETIHGDTGLAGKAVQLTMLDGFDPMKDAIAFRQGVMRVRTGSVPAFQMHGEEYGPYKDSDVELPVYAALYLILKRLAKPLE